MKLNDNASLTAYLRSHTDTRKADFDRKLIPNCTYEFLGWQVPELRKLAKELVHEDADRAWAITGSAEIHEMILLHGFIVGYAAWSWEKWQQAVNDFVPFITNWAICDMVCCTLTTIRAHRAEGWDMLRPYIESHEEFEQRFAVVMLMDHYLTDEYFDRVLEVLKTLQPKGYYAAMAIGWALQTAFLHQPNKVFPLLTDASIALESRVLARKKILESLRTPETWRFCVKILQINS